MSVIASLRAAFVALAALSLTACGINSVPAKQEVATAKWADVQSAYQRRADLIPNLVATVRGAAASETTILTNVTNARARATSINITTDDLSNPAEFQKHVENGRQVYYRNCVFCHGDNLASTGMFVHALDPLPTNFTDAGTIPMLRETFLFWRIAKGGPGLPEEGGPWDSAMPAWEKMLKDDEMWDAVLFLYDFTGRRPRAGGESGTK